MGMIRKLVFMAAITTAAVGSAQATAMAATSSHGTPANHAAAGHASWPRTAAEAAALARSGAAIPNTDGPTCTASSGEGQYVCFYINGGGLDVNYFETWACSDVTIASMHIAIEDPGKGIYWNSPEQRIVGGKCTAHYKVSGINPAESGPWSAIFFEYLNGGYQDIAEDPLPVS